MCVTVIIPYFRDSKNISNSINSALKQKKIKNLELIIIDDENSVESNKILSKLKKKNKSIKVFNTKRNKGVSYARNIGIRLASKKYIAFLDSDDYWEFDKIYNQILFLKKKNLDVCYSDYRAFRKNQIVYNVYPKDNLNYEDFLKECPICCSSILAKSFIFKKNFFKNLKTKEDYELWLRLSKKKLKFGKVPKILTNYRLRDNSLSSNQINKIMNAFLIYYKFNHFNIIKSFFYCFRLYFNAFKKKYL